MLTIDRRQQDPTFTAGDLKPGDAFHYPIHQKDKPTDPLEVFMVVSGRNVVIDQVDITTKVFIVSLREGRVCAIEDGHPVVPCACRLEVIT